RGREIAASIADWMDSDDDPRPLGAESTWYSGRGYLPRNAALGTADLFLVKGMKPEDFAPSITELKGVPAVRKPISAFIAAAPTGSIVNPNYSSRIVLQFVPDMPA